MLITVQSGTGLHAPTDLAILVTCEESPLSTEVADLLEATDHRGRFKQTTLLYPRGTLAPRRLLLLGLGKLATVTPDGLRQVAALAVQQARELQVATCTLSLQAHLTLPPAVVGQALAEGLELGAYRYQRYKTGLSSEQSFAVEGVTLYTSADEAALHAGVTTGQTVARATCFARDLANGPPNSITPAALGQAAQELGQRTGLRVTVLEPPQLVEQGFGGILAVGQGSANPPRFIVLEYGQPAAGQPTLCLVGKGVTFDTGGISIKSADKMDEMKMDMSGAAAVLGTMQAVAELGLPLHVVGLVCAAENMPSATAYRPGDIITTLSGKTIEVLNTDAEGRIVLADGLFYAQRYKPQAIIDLATLTGAIVVALGPHATGLMSTDQALADQLIRAGETTGERVWQMPLWNEYREAMESDIADLKNAGGRYGGALTAAGFLAAFVGDYPWCHLDIAGTAWVERSLKPYQPWGATGVGVRLLVELLRSYGQ